jgi:type III secretory pathway component EscS
MKQVIKLTNRQEETILIGVKQIIEVTTMKMANPSNSTELLSYTKISSVGAMVSTNYVRESVEEIYELINQ